MTKKLVTVDLTEQIEEALRLMVKYDVGAIIVTDQNKPVGIITERDVTRAALRGDFLLKFPVRSLMSRPIQTVPGDSEIWRVFETMLKLGVRRLPVVDANNMLLGIVTERDLIRWVLRVFYEPHLPPELRAIVQNPQLDELIGRKKCPDCDRYQDECICVRTQLVIEE